MGSTPVGLIKQNKIEIWCNGSMTAFGAVGVGSNPAISRIFFIKKNVFIFIKRIKALW
jgi:hypothetical protein